MKRVVFPGAFNTAKLYGELVAAGVPEVWAERGYPYVLVVQQEEDIAVAIEEPLLTKDYEFEIGKDGMPKTELVWRRPGGDPVQVPAKLIPEHASQGVHVQLGPGQVVILMADSVAEAAVAKVVAKHDPTPPPPVPSLEDRIAAIENVASVKAELAKGKK